jgi:hypothetical protein
MLIMKRKSGLVKVGYFHNRTAVCGGSISRKSAKIPKVNPHRRRGRAESTEAVLLIEQQVFHLWKIERFGWFTRVSGFGVVLQFKVSFGCN